jgi:competence protein ComEC
LWVPADRIRGLLSAGAASLAPQHRALFEGIVLGDDRRQDDLTRFTFQSSGLSHLLVVSGSNVAFVLVAARPLTRRVPLRWRWTAIGALLLLFGTVVRWEPSVCRALAMAAAATIADQMGRRVAAVRTLLLAVVLLLCFDPLMVRSVGFQLSVAATAGLAVGARPIAERLGGPTWLVEPLAVVLAAQAGCLPLLVAYFGLVPAAGLLVNLVAVPIAGWVMVWGVTAGLAAGVLAAPLPAVAAVVHAPTSLMVAALDRIARFGASPWMPRWEAWAAVAVVAAVVVWSSARLPPAARRGLAVGLVVAACAWSVRPPPPGVTGLGSGARLEVAHDGSTVVYAGGTARLMDVAEGLERARIRRLDAILLTSPGPTASGVATALSRLWPAGRVVLDPPVG